MPVVIAVSVVALAIGLLNANWGTSGSTGARETVVALGGVPAGRTIPAGFLGLSLEVPSIESYAGTNPADPDPVFERLVRNLTPGQRPVLRIGGDSADWSWWPVPGIARPPGVTYTLTPTWLRVASGLQQALGARLILGVNLEADSPPIAAAEAGAMVNGLPSGSVTAFELGNEPELYGTFPWYRTADGRGALGRPRSYDFNAYSQDFARFASVLPDVPFAAPSTGGLGWTRNLGQLLADQPRIKILAAHRYPLQLCFTERSSPRFPTIAHLLSSAASTGLADSFAGEVAIAHARGLPLQIDELNTVACGADPAVSDTFASSLWALDVLFELARVGADGVNLHTFPGAGYELFRISRANGRWQAAVAPEYYGLLMFAQAVPAGSQLVRLSRANVGPLKSWATRATDGTTRIVLINKDVTRAGIAVVRAPGATGAGALERLEAPSVAARTGITLGGHSFGPQTDSGRFPAALHTDLVTPSNGEYRISLPAGSAAMLTLPARR